MVCRIHPVIRSQPICLSVVVNRTAKNCVWIKLAVQTDESLAIWNVIHLISETTLCCRTSDILVCEDMSLILRHSAAVHIVVLESCEISLIVLSWLSDVVIALERLCVKTPLSIHVNHCISVLCLLGCDHDDTVCTTRTVKSI